MYHIYAKADFVFAWLGQEENNCGLAIDLINALSLMTAENGDNNLNTHIMKKVLGPSMASHWTALGLFWKRSYWQRSWIMQELLAGKYVLLSCGPYKVYLIYLSIALSQLELQIQLRDISLFLNEPYKWEEPGPLLGTLRSPQVLEVRPTKKIGGILEAVLTFRSTLARDPRDNIFSSLGIVNSDVNCVTDFPVDYSISWQALFHRFAVHVITSAHSAGSLRLLVCGGIPTDLVLPS